ncbi:PC4-domain-containing protein [Fomitiporia mediterranea MF3/22]|uniref:PC4-domain-containing protein n=1 Tax=Fomitiporia mediterranea (strain MF3/22) TaxID=694068 RepID=UPI00044098FB|nr:PC4-domain-containing protein [Fomitiporia mediterranea MF3/22]EJD02953.1 PC4-domain-containing protein [Fomitiporia mediterranea MF3/22]
MPKRVNSEEDESSAQDTASEVAAPPPKKAKKSTEKKTEKKVEKSKKSTKGSSPTTSGGKKGDLGKVSISAVRTKGNMADFLVFTNSEGEKYIDLGKRRRATVRSFKGVPYIDIREFFGDEDDLKPGKKGISLTKEQWSELKANMNTIDTLIEKL